MGHQSKIFLQGEGRAWLDRNHHKLPPPHDPVISAIDKLGIKPFNALEIGCADGWRVASLIQKYGCNGDGVDPSLAFQEEHEGAVLHPGTADKLKFFPKTFDVVIYGWCLYLCDPEDYFKIAAEGDRVLTDNGYIIIYDFHSEDPYCRIYEHKEGVYAHKMDFAKLWLSHPGYILAYRDVIGAGDDRTAVTVLKKNIKHSFPVADAP